MHKYSFNAEVSEWELSATRLKLRQAYTDILVEQDCDLFVTLMFNRPSSAEEIRDRLKALLARLDRHFLGRRWQKKRDQRTVMYGAPEHLTSNAHVHCMFRRPMAERPVRKRDFFTFLDNRWKEYVPRGKADRQMARDITNVSSYMLKTLRKPDDFSSIILSTDFR